MVSIVSNSEVNATNFMKLRQYYREGLKYNFTVCLGGAFYGRISPDWFVEWVEANVIFGAEKILIYNMSMTSDLDPYVNHYVQKGLVDILPWNYDPVMNSAITRLQGTLLVDCHYRMRRRSRYLVQCDQDELLVPRHPGDMTWADMMERSGCTTEVYAYGARNLYYGMAYTNNIQNMYNNENNTGLLSVDITQRSTTVLNYPDRGKYIANTFMATFMGIHRAYAKRHVPSCTLPIEIGANHHYRTRDLYPEEDGTVIDTSTLKYKDILFHRVEQTLAII